MNRGLRPLDRFGSLKIKLGVLITAVVGWATVFTALGARLGLRPLYSIPLIVLTALLVTQVLARGMTSPIRGMTAAARAMAAGDYRQRVPETSQDEVGELARAFNRMAAQLERVEQQRRDLVANVSHELRTPVAALQAVLENIIDGVTEPDPTTLGVALAQTERLGRLVTDLLDLSRVDAGVVALTREPVAVRSLLQTAIAEATMADRGVHYVVDAPAGLQLTGDPLRLQQLVANLTDNAGRHAGPGGQVTLSAQAIPGQVVIDVMDNGPGIPVAERESVFERFNTGGRSGDGGTGLGLAIARWVTQLHGGTIVVADSVRGCDIRVTLPDPHAP